MLKSFFYSFGYVVFFFLVGCSQDSQDLSATFHSAFLGAEETNITPETVSKIPYASMYARLGENSQALLILGWVEQSTLSSGAVRLKWVSAEKEMIATEAGRIVKTSGLKEGNLVRLQASAPDPLSLGILKNTTPKVWHYTLSWQPGYHIGYAAISHFTIGQVEEVELPNGHHSLQQIKETVEIPVLDKKYTNSYWLDPVKGQVVASEQYIFPGSERFHLSVGKVFNGESSDE